jgi:hypothetical protein
MIASEKSLAIAPHPVHGRHPLGVNYPSMVLQSDTLAPYRRWCNHRLMRIRPAARLACALLPILIFAQAPKKKILRAADLPRFQYSINGKVEDLVRSEQAFAPFAAQVRKNVESVLRDYEIDDAATKRGLLSTLVALDILEGHNDAARQRLDEIKALEEKPAAKALSGLITRSILDARRQSGDRNSPAYRKAVYDAVMHALDGLPFDVVQNDLKSTKAGIEIASDSFLVGQVQASFDPVVEKTGGLVPIWRTPCQAFA